MNHAWADLIVGRAFIVVGILLFRAKRALEDRGRDLELIERALNGRKLRSDPEDVTAYLRAKYGARR